MYRRLLKHEIESLKIQGCSAESWDNLQVKDPFFTGRLNNVTFSGRVKLGSNKGSTEVEAGIFKPSGISGCFIQNCTIGDDVYLSNIGTLANYSVEDHVAVENAGTIRVSGETTFGNGHEIDILNEGGGRELPVFDRLSAQIAYLLVVYRHNKLLVKKLKKIISQYVQSCESDKGTIGRNTKILHSKTIANVNTGPYTTIRGVSLLEEGTIAGNHLAPVFIGEDVWARNFIVLSGSKIDSGAVLSSTFVGQGVQIGKQFSAENSAFFANCEAFHGEACSIFAGPYTVTHHKSTLLIAGLFSFYNAGSGTNQSNHMYKLGPVHQGIVERGSKTGSFSYMLWPCRVGAFSVVMDKHAGNFDTTELPFSYISVEGGKSVLTPAMNLFTVGTARDSQKWPARDRRIDAEKLDLIHFDLLNPFTAGKILNGIELLSELHENTPKTREFVTYKGIQINRLMLRTTKRYYELALTVYLTGALVTRLENESFETLEDIRRILKPDADAVRKRWIDLAGMLAEKSRIDDLIETITSGKITTHERLSNALRSIHDEYDESAWIWCVATFKEWKNTDLQKVSKERLIQLISDWKTSSEKYNNMVLKDAEKEFDAFSHIGFGPDGDENEKIADFENIRGNYETNSFILGLKEESKNIVKRFERLKNQLNQIPG